MGHKKSVSVSLFRDYVGKSLKRSMPLCDYSNFRIGGKADYFFEATSIDEFVKSIRFAQEYSYPYYIIGGGNNILFSDNGFRGLIIRNAVEGIKHREKKGEVEVFSGTPLENMVQFSVEEGLSGFEFLAGIPGTIGGAIFGNAGAFDQSIGSFLKEAVILDEKGKRHKVDKDYFDFQYRWSSLRDRKDILLKAVFELHYGERNKIKAQIKDNLEKRKRKHPPDGIACAGSYFKNPVLPDGERVPAAYFLEKVGAKNMRMGRVAVYPGHSNFIINKGDALARDVSRLAMKLKRSVKEKFGVELEEEVIFLPANSPDP